MSLSFLIDNLVSNAEAAAVWTSVPIIGAFIFRRTLREWKDLAKRHVAATETLAEEANPSRAALKRRVALRQRSHTLTDEDWSA